MNEKKTADAFRLGDLIVEVLSVVVKYRRFLSRFVMTVTVGAVIFGFALPKWYRASVSVFPAEKAELPTGVEGLGLLSKGFSAAKALTSLSGDPELDRYTVILKSATVLSSVIEKFDLVRVYEIKDYPAENTAKELLSNTEFNIEPEGNLVCVVYDKNPQRAANMANFFVSELNRVNSELMVQNARANREFIGKRYEKNMRDLTEAEDSLKAFQKKHGILALPEQTQASIKVIADLMGQIALKDVHSAILARTLSPDHPSVVESQVEVQELRKKLNDMNSGAIYRKGDPKIIIPFEKFPDLGTDYIRRYREVEIQYKILQFLTPVFEQAKVEEKRQTPSVLVLDKATPPQRKARPRVTVFALLGFVISTLIGLFVVFLLEANARLQSRHPAAFQVFRDALRRDWLGLRPRREREKADE
jgi:uncharacterized protein involved in exopolysaccharide biosynthesis